MDSEQLKTIAETEDLFVSPFREDGTTHGTPTQTWALVVGGNVYVRAANGQKSRWYRAAVTQKAGRVRVAGICHDVTFEATRTTDEAAIDAAYGAWYPAARPSRSCKGTARNRPLFDSRPAKPKGPHR